MDERSRPVTDPVLMAVLNRRIEGVVGKMQNTLLRTARSGVINVARDFSCAILTGDSRLIAAGESLPIHVMVGSDMMAASMTELHPELSPGDAFLHNSPYHGCSHAADQSILVPVIDDEGVHRFTVLAKAHQADIGNSMPTTYMATARDVYEEGALIFPAVKVQQAYQDIDDVLRFCMLRIRVPEQWRGDYLAALGAARIGERELLSLGKEIGWEVLEQFVESWFDYSEQRMISAIADLPPGRVVSRSVHDAFPGTPPEGIEVSAEVEVDAKTARISVDLRDNPDCMPCGFNLSEACARTAAMVGIFYGLGIDVPTNSGSFRRIDIRLRENCVVGIPRFPASCSLATTNVADRVTNAVQTAIAELGEGFGMAEVGAIFSPAAANVFGHDPRHNDRPFVNEVCLGDTNGAAAPTEDGWLTITHIGTAGLMFLDSIEVDELRHPIMIRTRRVAPDTEGAGRFRGAPGLHTEYGPIDCTMRVIYAGDGMHNPARGVRGGEPGREFRAFRRNREGDLEEAPGCADFELSAGETVIGYSCGGGGYGPPLERAPERVSHDVVEGYVSRERAAAVYGVIVDDNGVLDHPATEEQRSEANNP